MKQGNTDIAIIKILKYTYGIIANKEEYNEQSNIINLDISNKGITRVPEELWQLGSLEVLNLSENRLKEVPGELGKLSNLQKLNLSRNKLRKVPGELGMLSSLWWLDLDENELKEVPGELGKLSSLRWLYLSGNRLREVPVELGKLGSLEVLDLSGNELKEVSGELGKLNSLQRLYLGENGLREVPVELGELSSLQELYLGGNKLTQVLVELGKLGSLEVLDLSGNKLKEVSGELGKLNSLQRLYLGENGLREVPVELGELSSLQELYLGGNKLTQVPVELGKLSVQKLGLDGNPDLLTPPPEIVSQGTQAVLSFLRELLLGSVRRYEAKLILVGEGGTGKSSLLRALHGKDFDANLSTTHGIEVDTLTLPHPSLPVCELTLNTWDFGGQDIYRATHQFFLTKRSLYLVVWNARLGGEQGRLDYWLSTIRALAPDVPVFLVATHIDERAPDLNVPQYRKDYPQVKEVLQVSSKTLVGIEELKQHIAGYTAQLPLMGQPWPQTWIELEQELVSNSAHHISADTYMGLCAKNEVPATLAQGTLGNYLHDLGKVLYFRDDPIRAVWSFSSPIG